MPVTNPTPPSTTSPTGGAGFSGATSCIPILSGLWPWIIALALIAVGVLVWIHKLPFPPKWGKWFVGAGIVVLFLWWLLGAC